MKNVEFHFALENIFGKGKDFLLDCIKEARIFKYTKIIDSNQNSWTDLYNLKLKEEFKK